jgi:hypothetical protein
MARRQVVRVVTGPMKTSAAGARSGDGKAVIGNYLPR